MENAEDSPAPHLTQTRVQDMRHAIHEHLSRHNVYGQLRGIIAEHAKGNPDFDPSDSEAIVRLIRERGVVTDLLGRLDASVGVAGAGAGASGPRNTALRHVRPHQRYLHVRLLGGRAFLDNLDLDPKAAQDQSMVVSFHFGAQRFRSAPQPCACDPSFEDDFLLLLDPAAASAVDLIELDTPLHIVVTKEDNAFQRATVLGENVVDWRRALKTGFLALTVELSGASSGVPSGLLELQIETIPAGRRYSEEDIANAVHDQRTQTTALDREFLIYARRWWAEFHGVRAQHAERRVKVFAAGANGRLLPVTHFVAPLLPDRALDTPADAARFVSAVQFERPEDAVGELLPRAALGSAGGASGGAGASQDAWCPLFVFLVQRRGDVASHATLLCSLLLGFGLDAYCVVGARASDGGRATHMWVATRRKTGPFAFDVTFWEPTTGERFGPTDAHPYASVGSAFNHASFFANIQESDSPVTCDFDLDCDTKWKAMNPIKLRLVPRLPVPPLLWIPLDVRGMEVDFEATIRASVAAHRTTLGLPTQWDARLGVALTQALVSYEQQRVTQERPDLTSFQQCVRGCIGEGRTFKGFPLNVSHTSERRVLAIAAASTAGKEILELRADDAHLAVRVKIFAFPEAVFSAWIMIAARYRSLPQE